MGSFIPQPQKIYFFESLIQKPSLTAFNISLILSTDSGQITWIQGL